MEQSASDAVRPEAAVRVRHSVDIQASAPSRIRPRDLNGECALIVVTDI